MQRILFRTPPLCSPKVHSIGCLLRHNGFPQYYHKKPLGRPRHRWDDNIKMDLQDVGWGVMDWVNLAQNRNRLRALVNAIMNIRLP